MTILRFLTPCLSVAFGAGSTLFVAGLLSQDDPAIAAAEQQFLEMPPGEARRIKATFDRLHESPAEREHVESIHRAVTDNDKLDLQLQRVYEWWLTCDEEQRQDLRALTATPHRWVSEVERQFADTREDSILILVPDRIERGRRPKPLQVPLRQIDQFLNAALPPEEAAAEDLKWLQSVPPEDLRLAKLVVVTSSLFSADGRFERLRPNQESVNRVADAAVEHVVGNSPFDSNREPRLLALVCFSILRAIKDHLSPEFIERLEVSADDLEAEFATMNMSERISHMLADPQEAARLLNARLKSSEQDTPTAELARRLVAIDRARSQLRGLMRGGPGGGGRRNDRGRRDGERRRLDGFGLPRPSGFN